MENAVAPSRRVLLLRLSVVLFFAELAHGMLLYGIIPELCKERFPENAILLGFLPVSPVQLAGAALAAYTLAELAFKLPAGHYVDHHGPDYPLKLGLLVSLAAIPILLLANDPNWVFFGALLHGLGAAPIWPAVISSWTRGRSARERGEIMGQILTGWMAGLGIGVILGNILVGLTGRQELAANLAPLAMWLITIAAAIWTGQRLGYPCNHSEEGEIQEREPFRFPPELRIMGIGLFIQNLAFGCLILTFREAATEHLFPPFSPTDGTPAIQFGLLLLLGGAPAVLLLGPMGKVADRLGRRRAVIGSMLVVTPLIGLTPLLKLLPVSSWARFGIMLPGILVAAVAYALLLPAWHALALGRIPEQSRGRSLAILMSLEMAALAGGHLLGPALYSRVSFGAPFVFAAMTFGIMALLYNAGFILPREMHDEHAH